ncbi:hydroxymethylglutaryl-CoA lyase [Sphingopyxis sp. MSC1_008]|jgi:hydroxymethylglutaryl-CoA lyase|uniref:hydroxymethylglutaryl-CoA lyase n=1 Tax=Sphingopyxis sp. MSC1_008 TaxID=2909265 RepID=UPI0020BD75DB|nr:hydroxymethylglutaryl-CoA lyase [Sphingopyxis sp. MSC1_008]
MTRAVDVRIVEVGPRDGLQNEPWALPVRQRVLLIDALSKSGLTTIEAGSFVSPRRVPQMANTDAVLAEIQRTEGVSYPVLVPNATGMECAIAAGAGEVAVFLSATESFSQRNINCSIAQSFDRAAAVIALAQAHDIKVRGYVSCVLGCPYEQGVPLSAVVRVAEHLYAMGCYEISLGDTIGVGRPEQARAMVRDVAASVPREKIAIHFHDTFGRALENVLACMEEGVSVVDGAVGGLGGCPYAPGASGNLATEELVRMLDQLGVSSGVNIDELMDAAKIIKTVLGIEPRASQSRRRI